MEMTNAFWNWNGKYVGYRISDLLFNDEGNQLGYFAEGDEIYGSNGFYMGEIRSGNRLIANRSKKAWRRSTFLPQFSRNQAPGRPDVAPKDMLAGYQEFLITEIPPRQP